MEISGKSLKRQHEKQRFKHAIEGCFIHSFEEMDAFFPAHASGCYRQVAGVLSYIAVGATRYLRSSGESSMTPDRVSEKTLASAITVLKFSG